MERPHSRVRVLWVGRAVAAAGVLAGVGAVLDRVLVSVDAWLLVVIPGGLALAGVLHALARYRRWGFEIQDDALYLVRGVLTEVETAVPYVRVQHVDTRRGPAERLVGLSSLVVYTAGSRGADITIPGLTPARATALRDRLRDLAIESEAADAV